MRALKVIALLAAVGMLSACETTPRSKFGPEPTYQEAQAHPLRLANYAAADELLKNLGLPASANNHPDGAGGEAPFIVATLANIDALDQSSTLGRVISEHIASRLTQNGRQVVELKLRNGIYMKRNEGEFLLTREIREVAAAHKAQGVVVGTYGVGGSVDSARFVHVTLKLVDPASSKVLSAYDYSLPLDKQNRSLLRGK